jgi:nucleotide-binding universal stress UspA family protein
MYHSILVPVDGSNFAEHALPLALQLARQAQAGVQIVRVHTVLAPLYAETVLVYDAALDASIRKDEQAYLDNLVERLKRISKVPVTAALVEEGPIGEALTDHAVACGMDLVVMTTHGRGPLARAWLGSVADQLVRQMPVPILLVRPGDGKVDLAQEPRPQRMLIALDGSELSEQIIKPALAMASLLGTDVTLLRVIKPAIVGQGDPLAMAGGFDPWLMQQLQETHEQERLQAGGYLERIATPLRTKSLKVETRVLSHDQPAVAILEEVKAHRTDLVALATHGRSGLPRLVLGSVADKVVRGASIPVLVARPPTGH